MVSQKLGGKYVVFCIFVAYISFCEKILMVGAIDEKVF